MIITDLYIDGYGTFQNTSLKGVPAGLVLFLGNNEAGKSTFLGFVRDMLFGFPDGRSKEKTYPPLKGGKWGGSLTLQTKDWSQLILNRSPGKKGGSLQITGPQGENLSPEVLSRSLAGTTREVFKNVYAFSLSELQTLETLNNERVKDAIYSAGLGAGLSSLPDIQKNLSLKREKLFKSAGRQQEINLRLKKLDDVRTELKRVSGEIESFDNIVQEHDLLLKDNEELKRELATLRTDYSKLKSIFASWEDWIERIELLRQLEELPEVTDFPEQGLKKFEDLQQQLQNLTERRQVLYSEKESLKQRLEGLVINYKLLEDEQNVHKLAEQKAFYLELSEELLGLQPEINSKQSSLEELKQRLGEGWDREALKAFDCSLKVKEQISKFSKALQVQNRELERALERHEDCIQNEEKAREALKAAQKEVSVWSGVGFTWDEELVADLKRNRDRFAQSLEEISSRKNEYEQSLQKVKQFLAEIHPSWDMQDLQGFDTSLQVKERIEQFQTGLASSAEDIKQSNQELAAVETTIHNLQQKRQNKSEALQKYKSPRFQSLEQIRELWTSVQRLRSQKADLDKIYARVEILKNRLEGLQREESALATTTGNQQAFLVAALVFLFAALSVLGLNFAELISGNLGYILSVTFVLVSSLFGMLFNKEKKQVRKQNQKVAARLYTISSEKNKLEQELQEKQDAQSQLEQEISKITEHLGLKGKDFELEALESELEDAREILQQKMIIKQEIENLDAELQEADEKIRHLYKTREQRLKDQEELEKLWGQEITALGLSPEIKPAAALRILARIETAQTELAHFKNLEKNLRQLENFLQDYIEKALRLEESQNLKSDQLEQVLSAVDRHLERVDQAREWAQNKKLALKEQNLKNEELVRAEKARENAARELSNCQSRHDNKWQEWKNWLAGIGLDQDLDPELARESLTYIEKAQTVLNEIVALENKQQQFKKRLQEFKDAVLQIAKKLGREEPEERLLVPFLQEILEDLEGSKANKKLKEDLQQSLKEKDQYIDGLNQEIDSLENGRASLFLQAGVNQASDFINKGNVQLQRQNIMDSLQQLDKNLLKGTGYRDIETVQKQFAKWDRESLQKDLVSIEQDLEEAETRRQEISARLGELKAEQKNKASADDVARLRQQEEFLLEELHQLALRWSKDTLALFLLKKAKQKYEQEQQPLVLQTAGHYLSQITEGAYRQIYAPLGEDEIKVVANNSTTKRPEDLSRGTAEQLYLSLRFGYMDNAGTQGERLPVIMDDILVNFDQSRAEKAAAAVAELARFNQVLYFTCHPQTLELFSKSVAHPSVFALHNGEILRSDY